MQGHGPWKKKQPPGHQWKESHLHTKIYDVFIAIWKQHIQSAILLNLDSSCKNVGNNYFRFTFYNRKIHVCFVNASDLNFNHLYWNRMSLEIFKLADLKMPNTQYEIEESNNYNWTWHLEWNYDQLWQTGWCKMLCLHPTPWLWASSIAAGYSLALTLTLILLALISLL